MTLLTFHMYAKPSDTLYSGHYACSRSTVLKPPILFDVEFEVAAQGCCVAVGFTRPGIPDPR